MLLFIGVTISSSTGIYPENQSIKPISSGNILYVGGSGPGNYSKIQDAINDSSDGDTVYVYNDSSPYYENVVVDKSIVLIGEDKNTTVIDGSGWGDVVSVSADFVNINGFTIQNSGYYTRFDSGIKILSKYCNISDNFLENNFVGIFLYSSNNVIISNSNFYNNDYDALWIEQSNNNIITNNVIFSCSSQILLPPGGICIDSSSNNTISKNKISIYLDDNTCSNPIGNIKRNTILNYISGIQPIGSNWFDSYSEPSGESVLIFGGSNNTVSGNYLCGGCPLTLVNTSHAIVSGNTMVFSVFGVIHWGNYNISIIRNNFFKNLSRDIRIYTLYADFDLSDDLWDGNYWNRPRLLPKPIFGIKFIKLTENRSIPFPWINFDWNPAQEPYDIGV